MSLRQAVAEVAGNPRHAISLSVRIQAAVVIKNTDYDEKSPAGSQQDTRRSAVQSVCPELRASESAATVSG